MSYEKPVVETSTGTMFSLDNPVFEIEAIAHSLSMNCRCNGHVERFYSVAEHSILVSLLMEDEGIGDPFEGLLHDAHEAYLTDVPAPFKHMMPDWAKIDGELEAKLRTHFGLPATKSKECKVADTLAFFIEAFFFLPSQGDSVPDFWDLRDKAEQLIGDGWRPVGLYPEPAKAAFLRRYHALLQHRPQAARLEGSAAQGAADLAAHPQD